MKFIKIIVLSSLLLLTACATVQPSSLASIQKQGIQVIQTGDQLTFIIPSDQFFARDDQAKLNLAKANVLAQIADVLIEYKAMHILIAGYTDNIGSDQAKLKKSDLQAHAIAAYLWSQGIPLSAMKIAGLGDNYIVANNLTEAGSAANRRVVISTILN